MGTQNVSGIKRQPHYSAPLLATFVLLFLSLIASPLAFAQSSESEFNLIPHIQKLFPKATRIDNKLPDLPVHPVYQLDQILGYAWLSTEINDIPGFSGSPIHLLIGLNAEGKFQKVIVLDHNEPVFLHGLGNEALDKFLTQYSGHSVTDQMIISTEFKGLSGDLENGPVYFDGVSKATISVEIINDVAVSTALKVARLKLENFALPSESALSNKPFEPMNWPQLLESKLIHHWQIDTETVLAETGRSLSDYPRVNFHSSDSGNKVFTDLFFAYLNPPDIGQNLLGKEVHAQLMASLKPEEHLIWVASNGIFPHISDTFKRGTVPARLSLYQDGVSIAIKDLDATNESVIPRAESSPDFSQANIFRIKGSSGFNLGSQLDIQFSIQLPRNHLITDSLVMHDQYRLPQSQWVRVQLPITTTTPLWLKIWMKKIIPLSMFLLSLFILIWVFIKQHHYSKHAIGFTRFRWVYLWFTLLFTGFYLQGQLSVVNIFTLFHSIKQGFNISIFLLDPVIFILWIVTFLSLFIWGRGLFCGWLCPFGALQEILSAFAHKIKLKQIRVPEKLHRQLIYIKYPILIGLVVVSFYSLNWSEKLAEIEPFKTSITLVFERHWPFVVYALILLLSGMFIHKFYCRYICPLGAGLAIIGALRRFEWLDRLPICGKPCQTCNYRCQIDAIKRDGTIDYNECIQCLECIVILNSEDQCVDKLLLKKNKTIPLNQIRSI